jgi:hypothetical protein
VRHIAEKMAMDRRNSAGMKNVNGDGGRRPIIYSSVTPLIGLSTLPFSNEGIMRGSIEIDMMSSYCRLLLL